MRSKTFSAKNVTELEAKLKIIIQNDFQPTVSILFTSPNHDLKKISQIFTACNIDLIGGTSAGEICDKAIYDESIVVLVMNMDKTYYRTHFVETKDQTTYQISHQTGLFAKEHFDNPGVIVLSGGMTVDGEQIVLGMKDAMKREFPLFGGLAGANATSTDTFVFNNDQISTHGILSLIIDTNKVEIKGMATSGWEAIGNTNTITKSKGNVLYSINHEPALDVFIKYFGYFNNVNVKEELLNTLSGQYPLQIIRDGENRILRAPVMANEEDRTLILAGGVKEGDQFKFSIAPGFEVIDQTLEEFGSFKETTPADAMILFSCKGRHAAFGPMLEDEVKGISDYWNAPMIGFMTYGEIGPTKNGTCEFHNETCSLVTFKEK